MRLLVIDDDNSIAGDLANAGHLVERKTDSNAALIQALSEEYDALIIERRLDGLRIARTMRASETPASLILVSSSNDTQERLDGFYAGADDCMTRPVATSELCARLDGMAWRASLRAKRAEIGDLQGVIQVADLTLDARRWHVSRGGRQIRLENLLLRVLHLLMLNQGQVVKRKTIKDTVWDQSAAPTDDCLNVLISRLREQVDRPFDAKLLHTIRGTGYMISAHE